MLTVLILVSCEKIWERETDLYEDYHDNGNISNIIKFTSIDPNSIAADSMSSTIVNVQISSKADSAKRFVLLTTNKGRFINGNDSIKVHANTMGNAFVELYSSSTVGIAKLSAIVDNIEIDTTVVFETAYPEDILLSTSDYIIDSNEVAYIKVTSYREIGKTSQNLKVNFEVEINDTALVYPLVPRYSVLTNDTCTIKIENPYQAEGAFNIVAKVPASQTDMLVEKIKLIFN